MGGTSRYVTAKRFQDYITVLFVLRTTFHRLTNILRRGPFIFLPLHSTSEILNELCVVNVIVECQNIVEVKIFKKNY